MINPADTQAEYERIYRHNCERNAEMAQQYVRYRHACEQLQLASGLMAPMIFEEHRRILYSLLRET